MAGAGELLVSTAPSFDCWQVTIPLRDYPNYYRSPAPAARRWGLLGLAWRMTKLLVLLAAVGCAGWLFLQRTVHNEVGGKVQQKVDQLLAGSGIGARIGSVQFIENRGLKIQNLSLSADDDSAGSAIVDGPPVLEIYEAFVKAPVTLPCLVAGNVKPASVDVRRAKLNVTKNAAGQWNLEPLVNAMGNLKLGGGAAIPVHFHDCQIEVLDQTVRPARQMRISNLTFSVGTVEHQGRPLIQVDGKFTSRSISQFGLTAWIDLVAQNWSAKFSANDLRLYRDSLMVLPSSISEKLEPLKRLEGHASASGTLTGDTRLQHTPRFEVQGKCWGVAIADQRLPLSIDDASANFRVNNEGFGVRGATGMLGEGTFQTDYDQTGWLKRHSWSARGHVNNFFFQSDHRYDKLLPSYCSKFCRDFLPVGTSNVRFDLAHDGTLLKRTIDTELTDMSFTFHGLPYKVNHCRGASRIVDGECEFQVQATEGDQPVGIRGTVHNLGVNATYECHIAVPGSLPINEKMTTAMQAHPQIARAIGAFNPVGRAGGTGVIRKAIPQGPVSKHFLVQLHDVAVRHDHFQYPLRNVNGLIEARDGQYSFSELQGRNGNGKVVCRGTWDPVYGLNSQFACRNVPLDDQLRSALKPAHRDIWDGFRPRGTVDLIQVGLRLPIGASECDVSIDATLNEQNDETSAGSVSIFPTWFPYELKGLAGRVKIGGGKIDLTDIEGRHNRTWLVCNGDGDYSDDAWSVRLKDMLVLSLAVDDDLLAAVPTELAPQVRQLQFQGKVNVKGEMTLAGKYQPEQAEPNVTSITNDDTPASSTFSLAWNVRLDMDQAQMLIGVPVENVFGTAWLKGDYDGQQARCQGELEMDSITVYDMQLTDVRGPFWLDNHRGACGTFAHPVTDATDPSAPQDISPIASDSTPPQSVTAQLHGGVVKFDAQIKSDKLGEFYLQSTLADGDLEQTVREFSPSLENVKGRTFAAIRLAGNCSGTHTYRGDGTIQLREAEIYELPNMLSLLKTLRVRNPNRSAFDSSNVDFTIRGETFDFGRIELLGDPISLIGNGRANLDQQIDLNFYSIMGRNKFNIPLVSELYHASSQQVLWINVSGTTANPKMTRNVLPQLNDSLRQLFQPAGSGWSGDPTRLAERSLQNAARNRSPTVQR